MLECYFDSQTNKKMIVILSNNDSNAIKMECYEKNDFALSA